MRKLTIEDMHAVAKSRGGRCLSDKYVNEKTKLKWECKEKHTWEAAPERVKHSTWCPYCARNVRLSIEELQKLAELKEGKCLSTEYTGLFSKYKWQCKEGHIWTALASNVKHHDHWCPHCSKNARYTLEAAQKIAKGRGGECLSTEYKNMHTKMGWKCAKGHIWKARLHDIKDDETWCPYCASQKTERICRAFLEAMFKTKFPKVRPDFLKSTRGESRRFNLELDGYNDDLKLAFEFQGHQHFIHSKLWHGKRTLKMQKERDEEKKKLCKENGITLIEIPYNLKYKEIGKFIMDKCLAFGIKPLVTEIPDYKNFDIYSDLPAPKTHKERYLETKLKNPERYKQLKRESDRRYLEKNREKLKAYHKKKYWTTRDKIIAERRLKNEKIILRSKEFHLNQIRQIAEARGGKCLTNEFVSAKTKMEFECKEGHRWFTAPHHVKDGSWCPKCYFERKRVTVSSFPSHKS